MAAGLLLVLTGCRLDLAAEAVVAAGGGGTVSVVTGFDADLLEQLDALGVDPTTELEAVSGATPDWETTRRVPDGGGLEVTTTRSVEDDQQIGDALRELSAGLNEADPALAIDVEFSRDDGGASEVRGSASLRPPATAGASLDGVPVGPDARELAALVADTVDARLRIRFPGTVGSHDGTLVDERTVVWELGVDRTVPVGAVAAPPRWWAPFSEWWARSPATATMVVAAVILLLTGGGWLRHRARSGAREPSVD